MKTVLFLFPRVYPRRTALSCYLIPLPRGTGLQPSHDLEAALITTIQPGQYTAQVRGTPETTGIGVVQVYFLQ